MYNSLRIFDVSVLTCNGSCTIIKKKIMDGDQRNINID